MSLKQSQYLYVKNCQSYLDGLIYGRYCLIQIFQNKIKKLPSSEKGVTKQTKKLFTSKKMFQILLIYRCFG